jgi:hypothetical protein
MLLYFFLPVGDLLSLWFCHVTFKNYKKKKETKVDLLYNF